MNCCDEYGDCRQGRDCPVRTQGAKVARIGRKDYAREPLRGSPWRVYLRHLAKWMLILLAVMTITPMVVSLALAQGKQPPATDCQAVFAKWRSDPPAHIRMKCNAR